jgi:FK506-binding nuclear protein
MLIILILILILILIIGPSGFKFADGSSNKLKAGISVPVDSQKKRKQDNDNNDNKNSKTDKEMNMKKKQKVDNNTSSKSDEKPKDTNINNKKKDSEQNRNKSALTAILGNTDSNIKNIQGVLIEDMTVGNGRKAESGNRVKVNYIGKLKSNNKVFDASKGRPFVFKLGRREVITGWDIGVVGMSVGGTRKLTIPPEKAYGKTGAPPTIPPNATLIFEVTLLEVNQ